MTFKPIAEIMLTEYVTVPGNLRYKGHSRRHRLRRLMKERNISDISGVLTNMDDYIN